MNQLVRFIKYLLWPYRNYGSRYHNFMAKQPKKEEEEEEDK